MASFLSPCGVFMWKAMKFHKKGQWTGSSRSTAGSKAEGHYVSLHTWEQLCAGRCSRDRRRPGERGEDGSIYKSEGSQALEHAWGLSIEEPFRVSNETATRAWLDSRNIFQHAFPFQ